MVAPAFGAVGAKRERWVTSKASKENVVVSVQQVVGDTENWLPTMNKMGFMMRDLDLYSKKFVKFSATCTSPVRLMSGRHTELLPWPHSMRGHR